MLNSQIDWCKTKTKCDVVFKFIKKILSKIVFLQETHLHVKDYSILESRVLMVRKVGLQPKGYPKGPWVDKIFHSNF